MTKPIRKIVVLALAVSIVMAQGVGAATKSAGISITPRKDYTIQPSGMISDSLRVANLSKTEKLNLTIRAIDFSAQGETGTPKLELRDGVAPTPWSIRSFMTLPKEISLEPSETKYIPLKIEIPAGQGAGSYYGAVQYISKTEGDSKNVVVAASGATLVFVNVPGSVRERMSLQELGAFQSAKDGINGAFRLFFFGSQPQKIAYVLRNEGNMVERPQGSISLTNMFGKTTHIIKDANPQKALALISQSRRFEVCIKSQEQTVKTPTGDVKQLVCTDPELAPGRYTVHINAFYGQVNQKSFQIIASNTFWYLPIWFLASIAAVAIAIAAVVWWLVRMIRQKRHKVALK